MQSVRPELELTTQIYTEAVRNQTELSNEEDLSLEIVWDSDYHHRGEL